MLYKDLENDDTITSWLNATTHKQKTRRIYLFAMQFYTEYVKMTPEELLLEAETDIQNGVLPRLSNLKRHLLDYKEELRKQNYAPLTIKAKMTGVYSFYTKNDIPLPALPRNESRPRPLKQHKEIPSKEDLQVVLSHCDVLERSIMLIGISSGLSLQEITNLTVNDFRKGYDKTTGVTTLKLRREKEDYDFITFLTPEASNAVLIYLESRGREPRNSNKEHKDRLAKQRIYDGSNYLLISRSISNEYLKTRDENLRKIADGTIVTLYQNLADSANKAAPKGQWNTIRSHNMRKYFNSMLLNAGMDSFTVEFLMGHTLDDTRSAYLRASAEGGLKDTYMNYMHLLIVAEAYDPTKDPSFNKLKEENSVLTRVIQNTAVETKTTRDEVQELRKQLEDAKNDYQALQADKELSSTVKQHEIETAVAKQLAEFKKEMLGESQERIRKNMKEPPIDIKDE
jgi:integrase